MKRKIIGFFVIVSAIFLLTACSNNVNSVPSATSPSAAPATVYYPANAPQPSPSPSPSPDVNYIVKTDYSQLTPYEPPEEIYTRLSEDYMPELVPSDDYGMLVPYVGEVLYDNFYGAYSIGSYEGLVTLDGMMVTDTVFSSVHQPYVYSDYSSSYTQKKLYILEKITTDITSSGEHYANETYAVCALDGSWSTPFDYEYVTCCDQVMLLIRNLETNDFDVMDYDGNILYNTKELACFEQLGVYDFYWSDGPAPMDFGDGYIALWSWEGSVPCAYLNEVSGDLSITEYSDVRCFSDGLAAAQKDGLWGYIDTSFSLVIDAAFENADIFHDGKAIVQLTSGKNAIIDTSGNILSSTARDIDRDNGYFEFADSYANKTVYDSNLNEIFNTNKVKSWGSFYHGYFYVKDTTTTVLFNNSTITLPGKNEVYDIIDNYFFDHIVGTRKFILMTLQGQLIAELAKPYSFDSVVHGLDGTDYFLFTDSDSDQFFIINDLGETLAEGYGYVHAIDGTSVISVSNDQFFGYMDLSGKYIFRISLQDSMPD